MNKFIREFPAEEAFADYEPGYWKGTSFELSENYYYANVHREIEARDREIERLQRRIRELEAGR